MMFDKNYSNVLILYISLGGITYFIFARKDKTTLKDYATD